MTSPEGSSWRRPLRSCLPSSEWAWLWPRNIPWFPSEIIYQALTETQGKQGGRGMESESRGEGLTRRPFPWPLWPAWGHLVPLKSLVDVCVDPEAGVVFETLRNIQNKFLPFENAEAHFWPFGPKLWGAASQGARRMSSRQRAVPSRPPQSLSGPLPSAVYWFPEGLLPTRVPVSHWVLQKGLVLLPTASELCAPVGGGTTHPFVSHYPWWW